MIKRVVIDFPYPERVLKSRLRSVGGFYPFRKYLTPAGIKFANELAYQLKKVRADYSLTESVGVYVKAEVYTMGKVDVNNTALVIPIQDLLYGGEIVGGGIYVQRSSEEKTYIDLLFYAKEV